MIGGQHELHMESFPKAARFAWPLVGFYGTHFIGTRIEIAGENQTRALAANPANHERHVLEGHGRWKVEEAVDAVKALYGI